MQTLNAQKVQSWLLWFFRGILLLGMLILVGRLAELQIIKGGYYHSLAEDNRVRRVTINAPRGKILARGGEVLVDNEEITKQIIFDSERGIIKKEITGEMPQDTIKEWQRRYPLGSAFAHVSGYLGEANEEEVFRVDGKCQNKGVVSLGTMVGRGGLEAYYECLLRGIDGEELVEVDTFGNKARTIGRKQPFAGEDLKTTIDYRLQKIIANRLSNKKGSIIVSNTKGEILGLYSSPSFDPNDFISKNADKIEEYFNSKSLPMFNRVIGGAYHPGSVFKMVTATAALEENAIEPSYEYEDTGSIVVNDYSYANWYFTQYGSTEGMIDLPRALARSTDTFFYKVGELTGPENIAKWANIYGFGERTGIDLPGEIKGLVPSPQWKKAVKGERWFLGNTYHMSIGQGDLEVTALQVNAMTVALANGGKLCKPHLAGEESCKNLEINAETFLEIQNGMKSACGQGGTAYPFFDFSPLAACKTGTAETLDEDKTHAWFTVYAPLENPEIVVTVLVENGGEGSEVAAPIAREIFDWWFHDRNFTADGN